MGGAWGGDGQIEADSRVLMGYAKPVGGYGALADGAGLIGYPSFTSDGISCACCYDPNLKQGGAIELQSIVPRASGRWKITKLTHKLSAYMTGGGSWNTAIEAAYIGGGNNAK